MTARTYLAGVATPAAGWLAYQLGAAVVDELARHGYHLVINKWWGIGGTTPRFGFMVDIRCRCTHVFRLGDEEALRDYRHHMNDHHGTHWEVQ